MEARELRHSIEVNPNREYMLAGDISMSMTERDARCGGMNKYDYMLEKFKLFIHEASKFDKHGAPTILLFGERVHVYKDTTLDEVNRDLTSVRFEGYTFIDRVIEKAYEIHREEKREMKREGKTHPGTVLFVFTDGAPTNRKAVEDIIVDIANHIEREDEFNITFLTVGTIPRDLEEFLDGLHDNIDKRLDQDFDIFHCEKLEDVDFLGAVNTVNHE